MRKALLLVAAGVIGVIGFAQIAPPASPAPEFTAGDSASTDIAAATPSAWYCPWVSAGDVIDTDILVASEQDAVVDLTLFDPLSNAEPASFSFDLVGPEATAVESGNVMRRGDSPAIVEISDGPASASSMQWSDGFVSADRCIVSVPDVWYLQGGATKTGSFTQLRLFNPFADNAEVEISAFSEFNLDLIPDLEAIDVAGRAWTTIDFEPFLPFRDELAFRVQSTKGLVIPVLVRTDEHGEAMWTGTGLSGTWDFPVAAPGALEPSIAVMSGGTDGVVVTVDIVTPGGVLADARTVTLDSSAPALIALSDLADPPYGVRVRATAPVAASVVATVPEADTADEGGEEGDVGDESTTTTEGTTETTVATEEEFIRGLAGMAGIPSPSASWIVPLDTIPGSATTIWLMNTGLDPATVDVLPLGEGEFLASETLIVDAGTVVGIPVDVGLGTFGYQLSSDEPITVAWEIVGDRGAALSAGIPSQ